MSTWWSTLKQHIPPAQKRGLVLLWEQPKLHKLSHFHEPKFPNCASVSRDRCSPDVSWTTEYSSCLPWPMLPQLDQETCASHHPDLSHWCLWLPKGLLHSGCTGSWPSCSSAWREPCPTTPPLNGPSGFPVGPMSRPFPGDLALFTALLPFPGVCWWLNSPWNTKCNCHHCVFMQKEFPSFQLAIPVPGFCAHFLLRFQVMNPARSQAHLWELLI